MNTPLPTSFGAQLRQYRERVGLTQEALAERGVDPSSHQCVGMGRTPAALPVYRAGIGRSVAARSRRTGGLAGGTRYATRCTVPPDIQSIVATVAGLAAIVHADHWAGYRSRVADELARR